MKYFLIIIALFFSSFAEAQTSRNPCFLNGTQSTQGVPNCTSVGITGAPNGAAPLPVAVTNASSSPEFVQGVGAAGAPLGGVLSVQGVAGGVGQPVSIDQTTSGTTNGVVSKGGASLATSQVALTATAVQVAAARAGRLAITITVAGTAVDTFCGPSGVTILTGDLIVGTKGASKTYSTGAAIFCVTGTVGTVSVAETF